MDIGVIDQYLDKIIDEINFLNIESCVVAKIANYNNAYTDIKVSFAPLKVAESKAKRQVEAVLKSYSFILLSQQVSTFNTYTYICRINKIKEFIRIEGLNELSKQVSRY